MCKICIEIIKANNPVGFVWCPECNEKIPELEPEIRSNHIGEIE